MGSSMLCLCYAESATDEDLQMLLSELLILKYVNKTPHPNIIRLVGCCTQGLLQINMKHDLRCVPNVNSKLLLSY